MSRKNFCSKARGRDLRRYFELGVVKNVYIIVKNYLVGI
jgi:hypothetical protein